MTFTIDCPYCIPDIAGNHRPTCPSWATASWFYSHQKIPIKPVEDEMSREIRKLIEEIHELTTQCRLILEAMLERSVDKS